MRSNAEWVTMYPFRVNLYHHAVSKSPSKGAQTVSKASKQVGMGSALLTT